jgi:hypothetical protein
MNDNQSSTIELDRKMQQDRNQSVEPLTESLLCSITSTGVSHSRSRQVGLKEDQNSHITPAHGRGSKSGELNTTWQGKTHPDKSGASISGRGRILCCRKHTLVARSKSAVCHWRSTCVNVICAARCISRSMVMHGCIFSDVITWT